MDPRSGKENLGTPAACPPSRNRNMSSLADCQLFPKERKLTGAFTQRDAQIRWGGVGGEGACCPCPPRSSPRPPCPLPLQLETSARLSWAPVGPPCGPGLGLGLGLPGLGSASTLPGRGRHAGHPSQHLLLPETESEPWDDEFPSFH